MNARIVVDRRQRLAQEFVARVERASAAAIAARGRCALAIAGGSVADAFLPPLATASIDWPRVDVFWCDERAVPPDDPESNYGAAAGLLFNRAPARAATLHRLHADGMDLDAAAFDYEVELRTALGEPPRLDLVLIGAGPDGHVCSLFPGHPAEDERQRWVIAVHDAPKPPPRRLTMTLPVLETARCLCLGVFGRDKAAMVREILEEPDSPLPAARVLRGNEDVLCLLDDEAASLLSRG